MDRKDQGRKEPTLADLEAFEQLLRESLQVEAPPKPAASAAPELAQRAPEADLAVITEPPRAPDPAPAGTGSSSDLQAMAELARLINQPVDFGLPPALEPEHPAAPAAPAEPVFAPVEAEPHHVETHYTTSWTQEPALTASYSTPAVETVPAPMAPMAADRIGHYDPAPSYQPVATAHEPIAYEPVAAAPSAPQPAPAEPFDPLAAFEQELRRFDAIRVSERQSPPIELRTDYPAVEAVQASPASIQHDPYAPEHQAYTQHPAGYAPAAPAWADDRQPAAAAESEAQASLQAAEDRLAAQAAAAAAAAQKESAPGRSKGIFLALGGIAIAGGAVLAGTMFLGSGSSGSKTASGSVPVIAAKPEPTKEKPANPGGMEIPNQNKQVLSPRNTTDTQPAQVVNNTEQPLDLNQVTRRDGVRVVAPSPYQTPPGTPDAASGGLEPRRVTSVRIPVGGETATPTTTTAVTAPAPSPTAVTAPAFPSPSPAPQAAPPRTATAPSPAPAPVAPPAPAPRMEAPPLPTTAAPPKVESRPTTAQNRPSPADPAQARPATPPARVATAPNTPNSGTTTRPSNAPMVLSPNARPATPAPRPAPAPAPTQPAAGEDDDAPAPAPAQRTANANAAQGQSGGYAVQLASRPTEDDARNASTQLRNRYGAALGGKTPSVVSGTANGQTVYRVRVAGYSQAAAVEACNKVKAAGGSCFVTRQ